jgi:hypothetical protein
MTQLMLHPNHFGRDWSSSLSQLMLHPHMRGNSSLSSSTTTNTVDWVVRRSNHRAVLSLATTGLDLPVPAPEHGSPPAVPRLVPSGTAPCMVPRPKGPVYQLRGCWPFVYVMPQDVAVYRHAGRSSLLSWGTFRAAWTMPDRDVLIAAACVCLARESCKLVRDVVHHRRTSAGRTHCYSVSS